MKIRKTLLSLVLTCAMALGLLSGMTMTALADGTTSYTITIPATLTVANSGWNATDGISATGTLESGKKLTVTAASTNSWALKSGDNSVGYTLTTAEAGSQTTSWEFTMLPGSSTLGIIVDDYSTKPAGTYQDTVTFTAAVEDAAPAGTTLTLSAFSAGDDPFNGGSGSDSYTPTFAAGGQIAIIYQNTSGQTVKVVTDALTAEDITNDGKSATINMTLDDADKTQDVTYIYPASMAKNDGTLKTTALKTQSGNLNTLPAVAKGSAAWNGDVLPSVTLENQYSIWKLTLANTAKYLSIMADNAAIAGATLASEGTAFYVAVPAVSSQTVTVVASDASNNCYYYSKSGVSLTAGNYYQSSPTMTTLGTDNSADVYRITGTSGTTIPAGKTVVLCGVNINGGQNIECSGDATIILMGNNNVDATACWYNPAISTGGQGTTLTITGAGSLTAKGCDWSPAIGRSVEAYPSKGSDIIICDGIIDATGGGDEGAAGIGGGWNGWCGNITITNTVTRVTAAKGLNGAKSIGAGDGDWIEGKVTIGGVDYGDGVSGTPYIYEP